MVAFDHGTYEAIRMLTGRPSVGSVTAVVE